MTTRKTLRVPVAVDGLVAEPQPLDRTRELPADKNLLAGYDEQPAKGHAAPKEVVDSEVTVPVHSSLESTLTFEMLRRQSTREEGEDDDGDEDKP